MIVEKENDMNDEHGDEMFVTDGTIEHVNKMLAFVRKIAKTSYMAIQSEWEFDIVHEAEDLIAEIEPMKSKLSDEPDYDTGDLDDIPF